MSESENINMFRLVLTQENVTLHESMFDGNVFNLQTRKYVDIRKILPLAMTQLQKTLSRNSYNTKSPNNDDLDYLSKYFDDIDSFPKQMRSSLEYNPESRTIVLEKEKMTIRGVECKIALYRNNVQIVERLFYVDRFNPIARWSSDLDLVCRLISKLIFEHLKKTDINYIWNEYEKAIDYPDEE